ncbi:MAG: hypothetical protein HGB19_13415 [Chlorobiales bacterium]|nr:hypothetical protein [Chlorobiales bacterium]
MGIALSFPWGSQNSGSPEVYPHYQEFESSLSRTSSLNIATWSQVRADASQVCADASQVRADASQVCADASQVRADASQVRADASQVRADASQVCAMPLRCVRTGFNY